MASDSEEVSDSNSEPESADLCSALLNKNSSTTGRLENRSMVASGKLRPPRKSEKKSRRASFSTSFTRKVKTNNVSLAKSLAKIKIQYQTLQTYCAQVEKSKTDMTMKYNSDLLYFKGFAQMVETRLKEGLQSAQVFIGHFMEIQALVNDFKGRPIIEHQQNADLSVSPKQVGSTSSKTQSVCPMVSGHTLYRPKISLTRLEMPLQAVATPMQTEGPEVQATLLSLPESPLQSQQSEPLQDDNVESDSDEQVSLLCRSRRKRGNLNAGATVNHLRETTEAFYQRVLSEDPLEGSSHHSTRAGRRIKPKKDYCISSSSSSSDDEEELNQTSYSVKDMEETITNKCSPQDENASSLHSPTRGAPTTNGPNVKPLCKKESPLANKSKSVKRKPVRMAGFVKEQSKESNRISLPDEDLEESIAFMSPISKEDVPSMQFNFIPTATMYEPRAQSPHKNESQLTESDKPKSSKSKHSQLAENVKHQNITANEVGNPHNISQPCNQLQSDVSVHRSPFAIIVDKSEPMATSIPATSTAPSTVTCISPSYISSAIDTGDCQVIMSNISESATPLNELITTPSVIHENTSAYFKNLVSNQSIEMRSPHLDNNRQLFVTCNKLPSQLDAQALLQLTTPRKKTPIAKHVNGIYNPEMRNIECKSAVETRTLRVSVDRLPLSKSAEPCILAAKDSTSNSINKKKRGAKRQADSSRNSETPTQPAGVRLPKTTRVFEEQIENKTSVIIKQELLTPSPRDYPRRTRSALGKIDPLNYKERSLNVKMRREREEK